MNDEPTSGGGFLSRLWRGELALALAFWLCFFLVQGLATVLLGYAEGWPLLLSRSLALLILAYLVVAAIGVWRSSARYQGLWVWSLLAKGAVLLFFAQLALLVPAAIGAVSAAFE
jgi:hypothetical protein